MVVWCGKTLSVFAPHHTPNSIFVVMTTQHKLITISKKHKAMDNNIKISIFENIKKSKIPMVLPSDKSNIYYVLQSEQHKYKVELLRRLDKGSKDYIEIKESLPCYTPSGTFSTRNKEGLIKHSGLICLDFDHLENPTQFRDSLKELKWIAYASLSCSGSGVFALVQIEKPELHTRYYDALELVFKERGTPIDPACKDVCRLRIASYDPDAWFNHYAEKWDKVLPAKEQTEYKPRTNYHGENIDQKLFLAGLDYIERYGIDITAGRCNWLALATFIYSMYGASGEEYFQALSKYHIKYTEDETRAVYHSRMNKTSFGIGVFVNACKRALMPDLRDMLVESQKKGGVL